MNPRFDSVLVANRGEIAVRVFRSARELGLRTIAVFSDADADAAHVAAADVAVRIGPGEAASSYLSIEAVLDAARRTGAQAIHPGYGFLSENAAFARACAEADLVFIGPPAAAIEAMGDKARAKLTVRAAGVACVPGYDGDEQSDEALTRAATEIGYPLLVKASAGGGGRGMRRVQAPAELAGALASARAEARAAFGDDRLLLERLIEDARHVEVQVFGDEHGAVIHLGERDCSTQRRHQKVIEEAPSPAVDAALRERLGRAAVDAARAVGYVGAGTVEFLLDAEGEFYFLEMNTRLQVEHPVTELITGLDLVEWQLRIAAGEPLPIAQEGLALDGHAIEARLYAEDPHDAFAPRPGRLLHWVAPRGTGVRCDAGVRSGQEIPPYYDPMLAKVIAHGVDREQARLRLRAALERTACLGLTTNRAWLATLIDHPRFVEGAMTTGLLEREIEIVRADPSPAAIALGATLHGWGPEWRPPDPWRNSGSAAYPVELAFGGVRKALVVDPQVDQSHRVRASGLDVRVEAVHIDAPDVRARIDGVERRALARWHGPTLHLQLDHEELAITELIPLGSHAARQLDAEIRAPSAGRVVAVAVEPGQRVEAGTVALKLEAMKIEASLACAVTGRVAEVRVSTGDQVRAGQLLVRVDPEPGEQETKR